MNSPRLTRRSPDRQRWIGSSGVVEGNEVTVGEPAAGLDAAGSGPEAAARRPGRLPEQPFATTVRARIAAVRGTKEDVGGTRNALPTADARRRTREDL